MNIAQRPICLQRGDSVWLPAVVSFCLCWPVGVVLSGCRGHPSAPTPSRADPVTEAYQFTDITDAAGIEFVHRHGGAGRKYYPETMVGGAALFDCDEDGDLDLYLVQSAATSGYRGPPIGGNELYRNMGEGHFERVTGTGGEDPGYGVGCIAADYDNDGDQDLYLCNVGPNVLLQNQGGGTFVDVTKSAGVSGGAIFTSDAAFGDYDCDGELDLFVGNYLQYEWGEEERWRTANETLTYTGPGSFPGTPNILYHNNGDGTFTDVTEAAGLYSEVSKTMEAVWFDYNEDSRPDLYVANDEVRDFLYRNNGDGTFTELGTAAGVAFDDSGEPLGSMSVCVADMDHDGRLDVFVSSFQNETSLLFGNLGGGKFADRSHAVGLPNSSMSFVKWGVSLFDFDLDGWNDVYVAHGHTLDNAEKVAPGSTTAQPDQLYRNRGDGTLDLISNQAGAWFSTAKVGRGVCEGDIDNDGDVDLYVVTNNGRGTLLRNDTATGNHWLRLKLVGARSNRDAYGAHIRVRAGELNQVHEVICGAGIFTGSDRRATFGLGKHEAADEVVVRWPSGGETRLTHVPGDQEHVIREGDEGSQRR